MIVRDSEAAQAERYDLIVIGGGIYGCALTLEAARAGWRPLMVERDDFGQHTSSSWFRILHGGLRYLQRLDLRRHFHSVMERRWFLANFPDLIEPLRCVMPLYGVGFRRRSVMAGAIGLDELLSLHRNRGLRRDRRLPAGKIISTSEVERLIPGIEPDGLQGGAVWYDAVCHRPQRLLMEVLRWGVMRGAVALNYVEARGLLRDGAGVVGIRARDSITHRDFEFRAPTVVNCSGPWSEDVASRLQEKPSTLFRPSLALNVLFDGPLDFQGAIAVSARKREARNYFLQSWAGNTLAGTYHASRQSGLSGEGGEEELIDDFIEELRAAAPWVDLTYHRVLRVFSGQLPVRWPGSVDLATREVIHDHGSHGGPEGLVSVSGVNYTLARRVGESTVSTLRKWGLAPDSLAADDLPPAPILPPGRSEMEDLVVSSPSAARRVIETLIREESVVKEEDLFLRRTDWGESAPPSVALVQLVRRLLPPTSTQAGV